jgi:hypothetical protein
MVDDTHSIVLYPFKLRSQRTGRWYRARWNASLEEIERLGGEMCGEGVACRSLGNTSNFMRNVQAPAAPEHSRVDMHPHWESPPAIDAFERALAQIFLRRYVTWCVRMRRYAEAQGAATLSRDLA